MKRVTLPASLSTGTLVLIVLLALIGIGLAYTAITSSSGNNLDTDSYVEATDEYGDRNIELPTTNYTKFGNTYIPDHTGLSLDGNLKVVSKKDTVKMRMWVELGDPISWNIVQSLKLYVDGEEIGTLFNYSSEETPQTCKSTDAFDIDSGNHSFRISVVFREGLRVDPSSYAGDNFNSKIVFMIGDRDPFSA